MVQSIAVNCRLSSFTIDTDSEQISDHVNENCECFPIHGLSLSPNSNIYSPYSNKTSHQIIYSCYKTIYFIGLNKKKQQLCALLEWKTLNKCFTFQLINENTFGDQLILYFAQLSRRSANVKRSISWICTMFKSFCSAFLVANCSFECGQIVYYQLKCIKKNGNFICYLNILLFFSIVKIVSSNVSQIQHHISNKQKLRIKISSDSLSKVWWKFNMIV